MSPAVAPGLERKSAPMPTSAVAIIELLIGFRVEPSSRGAVNLQPSGFDGRFPSPEAGAPAVFRGGASGELPESADRLDGRAASGAVTTGWL
ncbi:hypothetical protein GCM10017710_19600 [Arthrobacter ramosus]